MAEGITDFAVRHEECGPGLWVTIATFKIDGRSSSSKWSEWIDHDVALARTEATFAQRKRKGKGDGNVQDTGGGRGGDLGRVVHLAKVDQRVTERHKIEIELRDVMVDGFPEEGAVGFMVGDDLYTGWPLIDEHMAGSQVGGFYRTPASAKERPEAVLWQASDERVRAAFSGVRYWFQIPDELVALGKTDG